MTENQIQIYATAKPFSNLQVKRKVLPGSTVEELVGIFVSERIRKAEINCDVKINGHIIKPSNWHLVKPKAGTVVNIHVVPQGGGGGKKNPIATILTIALLVAAPYAGFALAASLVGTAGITFASVGILTSAFTVGVGIIGALAINALAPPPKQNGTLASSTDSSSSTTQFIQGATNQLLPYGVIPMCLGTNRMFPPQAARPYTETVDGDQYVRQLFTYGWGESVAISSPQLGETAIDQFTDIDLEHKLNGDLNVATSIYPQVSLEDDYNVLLQQVDGYTTRATQPNVDEAIIDVTFPQGLLIYDNNGSKIQTSVDLDISFAPTGTTTWSPTSGVFTAFAASDVNITEVPIFGYPVFTLGDYYYVGYRKDLIVLDNATGGTNIILGTSVSLTAASAMAPVLPTNKIRLSTIVVQTLQNLSGIVTTSVISHTDDRNPAFIGVTIQNSTDFLVTVPSPTVSVHIAAGGMSSTGIEVTDGRSEAIRKSYRIVFPSNGTYDVRIKRVSADSTSDKIFDKVYLTAIKSFTHVSPVNLAGMNGTAIRMKATDQLNGSINQFNVIVSNIILDFDVNTGFWTKKITSNPASLYRYVLQCAANAKALPDAKVDLDALEDWHEHCIAQGYTYNRIIDYRTTVDEILSDIASAGAASSTLIDGKRSVVIDRLTDEIPQVVTPRNSWDYKGEMTYPSPPDALRVDFPNASGGYVQDELIVYNDGFDVTNARLFETLSLLSCTNSDLAYKTARRHFASAILRPETHTFMMDVENLSFTRGARIKLVTDVAKVGLGQGRITAVYLNDDETLVTGIDIDDTITIPTDSFYFTRIRLSDGTQIYEEIVAPVGAHTGFDFFAPFDVANTPAVGDLAYFVEVGKELDLVVTKIEPAENFTAKITSCDYAPAVFDAENGPIPPFNSNITTPLEFIRPLPPVLVTMQSDESVMLQNSDGTLLSRLIITLDNQNEGVITTQVKYRLSGSTVFNNANVLEATDQRVILTGFDDGSNYDFEIRHRRGNSTILSAPLIINLYKFVGATSLPPDITGFLINIVGDTSLFKWNPSIAIDHNYYVIKYSRVFNGAAWETSQIIEDNIKETRLSIAFQPGTYLIKDVDILGNESENATAIITYDSESIQNVIEILQEDSTFAGTKDNVEVMDSALILLDTTMDGYYYFNNSLDLGGIYTSFISASIIANGIFVNNLFTTSDIFGMTDIFGGGDNDIFAIDDLFDSSDIFGIGTDGWFVELQYRVTNDDPSGSPTWGAWTTFVAGNVEFWAIEFRVLLRSLETNVSPSVSILQTVIDMPDRIERGDDQICDAIIGLSVAYDPSFKTNPSVVITIQDGDADDELQYFTKDETGFIIKIWNTVLAAYVTRTLDYVVSGYGRLRT